MHKAKRKKMSFLGKAMRRKKKKKNFFEGFSRVVDSLRRILVQTKKSFYFMQHQLKKNNKLALLSFKALEMKKSLFFFVELATDITEYNFLYLYLCIFFFISHFRSSHT